MEKKGDVRGYSLVEVVIAAVILGIVASASMKAFMFISKQSVKVDDRAYAVQKAIQMMEELRSLVNQQGATIGVLDNYDNGTYYKYTLSTLSEVNGLNNAADPADNPTDPISGNSANATYNSGKYKRKITVERTNESLSRRVYVRVYRNSDGELLAETASVLRTLPPNFVPSQVYDVYVLVLENVPGWWVALSTLAPTFGTIVQDLQNRNPGLNINVHYVTRLAYGRDPYYSPYINVGSPTNATASPWVYFLPGNIDNSFTYYTATSINANINVDGAPTSNEPFYPYSMADQFNHAVRQPDEERMYADHRAAYANAVPPQQTMPEPSLRMLLDRMNSGPGVEADGTPYDYRNAILINLHGELVPMPPLRNYSDPAKCPTAGAPFDEIRAVSHPENLRYASGAAVKLRVYSFVADPTNTGPFPDNNGALTSTATLTITVVSTSVANTTVRNAVDPAVTAGNIRMVRGNSGLNYSWTSALPANASAAVVGTSMTVITLLASPLRHNEALGDNSGLSPANARLYGLEYIPCPPTTASFVETVRDLADTTNDAAKNTARWVITFPAGTFPDGRVEFDTRIGTDLTAGITTEPSNLSRTYTWIGSTSSVPLSEQSQFIGDPRHCPYADVKTAHKFNWFFKDVNAAGPPVSYAGFVPDSGATLWNGFGDNASALSSVDVPRFWEVLRKALLNSTSLMNSVAGWSFFYMGIGGEMGADSNNHYGSGLPIMGLPWNPGDGTQRGVDEISQWSGAFNSNARIIAHSSDGGTVNRNWVGLNWIGELYPTMNAVDAASLWVSSGNLKTGDIGAVPNNQERYFRSDYNTTQFMGGQNIGAILGYTPRKQPGFDGAPSFFNGNSTGAGNNDFNHNSNANIGALTTTGTAVSQDFNFPLPSPLDSSLASSGHRIFQLNDSAYSPLEWAQSTYSTQRSTLSFVETYYDSNNSNCATSALIKISQNGQFAYFQPNGMSSQGTFGAAEIGKLAVTNLLRGFMTVGIPTGSSAAITQVPLVSISSPAVTDEFANPSSINVVWSSTWTRWDGQRYTSAYTAAYNGGGLTYNLKVSKDGGTTWSFINSSGATITNPVAKAGVVNATYAVTSPITWDVSNPGPGGYPQANYLIMVEAYGNRGLHRSFHQRQVFIKR